MNTSRDLTYRDTHIPESELLTARGIIAIFLQRVKDDYPSSRRVERVITDTKIHLLSSGLTRSDAIIIIRKYYTDLGSRHPAKDAKSVANKAEGSPLDDLASIIKNFRDRAHRSHSHTSPRYSNSLQHGARSPRISASPTRSKRPSKDKARQVVPEPLKPFTQLGGENNFKLPEHLPHLKMFSTKKPKGVFFVPTKHLWPKLQRNRIDQSRKHATLGFPHAYWKDFLITTECPSEYTAWTLIYRLTPFHGFGELFNIAIYNGNYREALQAMYDNVANRRTLIQIAGSHKDWKLTGWLPRSQTNELQLELDDDGKLVLNEILLYKEPLFVPTLHPERTPSTYAGTTAGPKLHPGRDFSRYDIYRSGKLVAHYTAEEVRLTGNG